MLTIYFNPRPPCGGRRVQRCRCACCRRISIHVPRVEDDLKAAPKEPTVYKFQSTSPVWRTTEHSYAGKNARVKFQSTSPVWRTTRTCGCEFRTSEFQSTSPVWRTTLRIISARRRHFISIHVPRVEDDHSQTTNKTERMAFQSTSPVWRTT